MSKEDNGGSAFPEIKTAYDRDEHQFSGNTYSEGGMTLRDYFAAKAMQALITSRTQHGTIYAHEKVPKTAYEFADAMLEARK